MFSFASRIRSIIGVSLGVGFVLASLHGVYFDPMRKAETYTRDLRQVLGRKAPVDPRLVFLAIDKSSVQLDSLFPEEVEESPALKMMKAGFPWSREVYALVTERLLQAGARVVAFDLLFPAPAAGDEQFRAALEANPGRVLLGCDLLAERNGRATSWRLDLPTDSLLPRRRPIDERLGYVTFWSDPDGGVRRARWTTSLRELGGSAVETDERFESLGARILRSIGRADLIPASGDKLFRFAGGPRTFSSQSIYEIFVPDLWERNFQSGAFFKDKIVLVGPEGSWSHDEHATPFRIVDGEGALMPGPEIHLNAVNAALHADYLEEVGYSGELVIIVAAIFVAMFLSLPRGILVRAGLLLAGAAGYAQICTILYNENGLLLLFVLPAAIVSVAVVINVMLDYRRERKEKNEIRSTLGHYVGQNVVEEILQNPAAYLHSLSGVRKTVTVLFSDLRGFTALTSTRPPADLIAQLNEYFSAMTAAVVAENGTVDKLVGDGMMAVWGNLRTNGPRADAHAALRCALAMRAGLQELNAKWRARGWPELRFGVGLNHGEATIGNIGSELKMDFTAIGEVINAAARIEQLTVSLGHDIVLGAPLASFAAEAFEIEGAGEMKVKGISQPLQLFLLRTEKTAPSSADGRSRMSTREPALVSDLA